MWNKNKTGKINVIPMPLKKLKQPSVGNEDPASRSVRIQPAGEGGSSHNSHAPKQSTLLTQVAAANVRMVILDILSPV